MDTNLNKFLEVRELIIKNALLNRLLTAILCKNTGPIVVATSWQPINSKLARKIEDSGKKVPKSGMIDITVSINPIHISIGLSYRGIEPISDKIIDNPQVNIITLLKRITNVIYSTYSLNPAHFDKVFSKIPTSFLRFLELNYISKNWWSLGFHKVISKGNKENSEKDSKEIILKYYNTLLEHLEYWRLFDRILIDVLKTGKFEIENNIGKLKVTKTHLNERLMFSFSSYITSKATSFLVHYKDLNHKDWEKYADDLSIYDLRALFSSK